MKIDGPGGPISLDRLPFAAHIEHAYTPRETALYGGGDHIVVDQGIQFGRLTRAAGDALCKPRVRLWGLQRGGEARDPSCQRCMAIARRATAHAGAVKVVS